MRLVKTVDRVSEGLSGLVLGIGRSNVLCFEHLIGHSNLEIGLLILLRHKELSSKDGDSENAYRRFLLFHLRFLRSRSTAHNLSKYNYFSANHINRPVLLTKRRSILKRDLDKKYQRK